MNSIKPNVWTKKETVRVLLFTIFLSFLFVKPFLFQGNLVYGDDLVYHLSRIKGLSDWLMESSILRESVHVLFI